VFVASGWHPYHVQIPFTVEGCVGPVGVLSVELVVDVVKVVPLVVEGLLPVLVGVEMEVLPDTTTIVTGMHAFVGSNAGLSGGEYRNS